MDDLTEFQKQYLEMLREEEREELASNAALVSSFKDYAAQRGLELLDDNFRFSRTIGIIATCPNIVHYLNPSLVNDKEGLMDFRSLCGSFGRKSRIDGYLYGEQFMLMAHPYFRRGFHSENNYAPKFVELFWNNDHPAIDAYISIDTDRVRINVDESVYMEKDTWWGARFSRDISAIPDGNVKLKPPADIEGRHVSFFFAGTYGLDIKWATKGGIKTFQAEEFKMEDVTLERDGNLYHPVRYIHAEYDLARGHFRHFDGAIHFYTGTEYYSRRDSDFNHNAKSSSHIKTLSQKLFKMNGKVDVDTWVEFSSHFMIGNPLVFEYFEGEYPAYIKEVLKKIRLRNVL